MTHVAHGHIRNDNTTGTGRATLGGLGLYVSLGVGLGILAFVAALFLRGNVESDAQTRAAGGVSLAISLLPLLAAPILAVIAGHLAGAATRTAGRGALAGALSGLFGPILLFLLVGAGLALGAAVGGTPSVDTGSVNVEGMSDLGFLASLAGVTYLLANLIVGAIAGAIAGGVLPFVGRRVVDEDVDRRPATPRV